MDDWMEILEEEEGRGEEQRGMEICRYVDMKEE